jgi:hypothetical protein
MSIPTRRERIQHILHQFTNLRDPAIPHSDFVVTLEEALKAIMDLSKPAQEITHVIGPNGHHRLIIDGVSTEWRSQTEIVRHGDYIAATDFYMGQLPQLARITQLDPKSFMTTSQQNLNKTIIPFVKPV